MKKTCPTLDIRCGHNYRFKHAQRLTCFYRSLYIMGIVATKYMF